MLRKSFYYHDKGCCGSDNLGHDAPFLLQNVSFLIPGFFSELEVSDLLNSSNSSQASIDCRKRLFGHDITNLSATSAIGKNRLFKSEGADDASLRDNMARLVEPFPCGRFFGYALSKDNAEIQIMYQVSKVDVEKGYVYALWISKDSEGSVSNRSYGSMTLSALSSSNSLVKIGGTPSSNAMISGSRHLSTAANFSEGSSWSSQRMVTSAQDNLVQLASAIIRSRSSSPCLSAGQRVLNESLSDSTLSSFQFQVQGSYEEAYHTMGQIGKGAFGCVKVAVRLSDNRKVVTKFIKKKAILARGKGQLHAGPPTEQLDDQECITNSSVAYLPVEIQFLLSVDHPNIVQILDVHENAYYYQLVMERHGTMDLFEFIDRRNDRHAANDAGDALNSHIFRQLVDVLYYLHKEKKIIHRDVKDENVIINDRFHVKLIDFGSAAFYTGEPFHTFSGTVEYCSPEVLRGNSYTGPELEMWSLGILLYILIFGEPPFANVIEILNCGDFRLRPPFLVPPLCLHVVKGLLQADPERRWTIDHLIDHPWVTQDTESAVAKTIFYNLVDASFASDDRSGTEGFDIITN